MEGQGMIEKENVRRVYISCIFEAFLMFSEYLDLYSLAQLCTQVAPVEGIWTNSTAP